MTLHYNLRCPLTNFTRSLSFNATVTTIFRKRLWAKTQHCKYRNLQSNCGVVLDTGQFNYCLTSIVLCMFWCGSIGKLQLWDNARRYSIRKQDSCTTVLHRILELIYWSVLQYVVQWLQYVFDAQQPTPIARTLLDCSDQLYLCSKQ